MSKTVAELRSHVLQLLDANPAVNDDRYLKANHLVPTAAELRERKPGQTFEQYCDVIRRALGSNIKAIQQYAAAASLEGRGLRASDQRDVDGHMAEAQRISAMIHELENSPEGQSVDYSQIIASGVDTPSQRDTYAEGRPLERSQKYADFVRSRGLVKGDESQLDLGKYLRGFVTGDWSGADAERRAMSEGVQTAGGHLVPTILAAQVIDLARKKARVLQAGAQVVPMENQKVDVAKWTGDPTPAFRLENAAISATDATLGKVTLTAKSLASLVIASRELIEDAPNVGQELVNAFAAQFALTVDSASLYGSGVAPNPLGVKGTAGITTQLFGGANGGIPANFDFLVDAAAELEINDEMGNGIIYAPRTAKTIAKFKDTTNQPLRTPEYLESLPRLTSNNVPVNLTVGTSVDTSDAFVADWSQLLVGVRTELIITPLTERYAENGQLGFVAWWRGDVVVARPKAFVVVTGLRP